METTTETTVAPTEALAPEQVIAEAATTAEPLEQPATEQPTEDKDDKAVKSLQRRLGKRTADYYREKAAREQLEREVAQKQPEGEPGQPDAQAVRRLIEQEATRIASEKERASKVDAIERDLRKNVADYDEFYADLASAGPAAASLLDAVVELDEAPKVLAHLAQNREELYTVLEMTGTKQAVALARIVAKLEAVPPKVSAAPKPITPVGSRSGPSGLDDSLPIDEWMKRRNAQDKR